MLVVVGVVLLVLGAAGAALALRGGDDAPKLEGGSSFGAGPKEPKRREALLDALAPLLAAGDAGPARRAAAAPEPDDDAPAGARLGIPAARAAARLMLVGFAGQEPRAPFFARLRTRGWGGVVLEQGNYVERRQLATLAGEVAVVSRQAGHGAPLVAALQPGGEGTAFPDLPPAEAGVTPNARTAGREARRAGRALRAAGIALTLAPVAHVGVAGGAWDDLAYGDEPATVSRAVRAAVDGYRATRVAPVVGRFPGEGAATQDPSLGPASVGLPIDDLRRNDMRPFAAVARRAPAIQMSPALYAGWDGVTPATLLPEAVRELRRLGFRGLVVSADLSATTLATGGGVGQAAVEALKAGCDLLWVPGDLAAQEDAYRAVLRAIRTGEVAGGHVAAALRRATALKRAYAIR